MLIRHLSSKQFNNSLNYLNLHFSIERSNDFSFNLSIRSFSIPIFIPPSPFIHTHSFKYIHSIIYTYIYTPIHLITSPHVLSLPFPSLTSPHSPTSPHPPPPVSPRVQGDAAEGLVCLGGVSGGARRAEFDAYRTLRDAYVKRQPQLKELLHEKRETYYYADSLLLLC